MSLLDLNNSILHRVLFYLPVEIPVRSVCVRFRALVAEKERYEQIALFIVENYSINPGSDPLWYRLRYCQVICLGETHIEESHRRLNAQVIHLLLMEGTSALMYEGVSQLKYVREKITSQATTWDIPLGNPFENHHSALLMTKDILHLFSVEQRKFRMFYQMFVEEYASDEQVLTETFQAYKRASREKSPELAQLCSKLMQQTIQFALQKLESFRTAHIERRDAMLVQRDQSMSVNIEVALQESKRPILVGGSNHFGCERPPMKKLRVPHLALTPIHEPVIATLDLSVDLSDWVRSLTPADPHFNTRLYFAFEICQKVLEKQSASTT